MTVEPLPNLWRAGLSALLAAETEPAALEAAVTTMADLLDGPSVGILRSRSEHLSSVAAHAQERYVAPLFVEALRSADERLAAGHYNHQQLLSGHKVVTIVLREHAETFGAICTLSADGSTEAESSYMVILEQALIRTIQRLRRLAETRLLYEISLRLGNTLDLDQLLSEMLALTASTFAATSSRVFLYDERADDLVVTLGPSSRLRLDAPLRIPLDHTVAGWVVRNGTPLIRNRLERDHEPIANLETDESLGKLICVPLKHSDRTLGALMLINQHDGPDFLDDDLQLLTTVAGSIAIMIANARLYQRAIRDSLTGAFNRGAFDNALHEYWERWGRNNQGFGLILLDLDNFKQINDRFGHSTGDAVLQSVTRLLWDTLREGDSIYRYGGEEFGVILPSLTDAAVVAGIAERLRAALDCELTISNLVCVRVSASVGVAIHPLHGSSTPRALLDIADDAAYQAKRAGKNQVVVAPMPN
jgi:diguanylate cyclase (GGDEF)-like protein